MAKRVSSLGHRHTGLDLNPQGKLELTYAATAGARNSTLTLYSGNPQISIEDTGAAANEGVWNIIGGTGNLKIRALSDDYATAVDAVSIERGTGATVDDVKLTLGATGALEIAASSYKTNPTGMRLGQYTSTIGYLQVPGNGQIDIWNGGTGAIARFAETGKKTTLFGNTTINQGNGEALTLIGGSTGSAMNSWIQWDESDNSRAGFIGYGSSGNTSMYLWNEIGDVWLQAGTGNPGAFYIFEDTTVADDATGTWASPTSTAHGIWIVKNSWDDSGDGMFAQTAQSVTQFAGGSNFQLGDNGTNPDVDGDVNCYMSNNYTLSIKNRTGGTRRFVVFYFSGG